MEFTLYTPEGFYGRIYTFGHYDRCFFRGSGGTVNILKISGIQSQPSCGSQRVRTQFIYISCNILLCGMRYAWNKMHIYLSRT